MKPILLFLLTLMSFSSLAQDLAQKHSAICQSEKVESIKGENGDCRVLMIPTKARSLSGVCTGLFGGKIPCAVAYVARPEGTGVQLVCGDPSTPIINRSLAANVISYSVAALITTGNDKDLIVEDPIEYTLFESRMINLSLFKGESGTTADVVVSLLGGKENLTNVVCD